MHGSILLSLVIAAAAPVVEAGDRHSGQAGQLDVSPPRVETGVDVDGRLDEPVWTQAARLTDFSQYAPADGRPASNATVVLVWYSPTAIFFGVQATAPPGSVRATLADRDRIDGDDAIEIYLGTFDDGVQALMFAVNPLGVQADGALVEGAGRRLGGGFGGLEAGRELADLSPDFVFDSKGRLTETGYEIEIRIPFKSLRYGSANPQDWGLHVMRRVSGSGHEDSWVPARRAAASFLGQAGRLRNLTDLRRGLVLDLNPVAVAKIDGEPSVPPGGWDYDTGGELGANIRWGITPNLTLNGTVNPDFSQVESDAGQFQFDPRQALFFPEKRPFFLDGLEYFASPNRLIYTRRMVAPTVAVKVTGKVGATTLAALSAIDDRSASRTGGALPVFNVLRVQRDLHGQSRAGLVYTDRIDGSRTNRVVAGDARLTFGDLYVWQLQAGMSRTETPGGVLTSPIWESTLSRNGRHFGLRYALRGIGEGFAADAGFISRPGIVTLDVSHQGTLYGAPEAFIERWTGDVRLSGTWVYDDFIHGRGSQDRKLHLNSNFSLRGGWRAGQSVLIETFDFDDRLYEGYRLLDGAGLRPFVGTPSLPNLDFVLTLDTPRLGGVSGSLFAIWGRDENFLEWSSADILFGSATVQWRPTERLRLDGTWQVQSYRRRSDGTVVSVHRLPRLKAEYQLTRAIFLRVVSQFDSERQDDLRDDGRTELPIGIYDPGTGGFEPALGFERRSVRTDWLFSYQPTPGTVLFAGYGNTLADHDARVPPGRQRTADGFFFKYSYLFRM